MNTRHGYTNKAASPRPNSISEIAIVILFEKTLVRGLIKNRKTVVCSSAQEAEKVLARWEAGESAKNFKDWNE